MKQTEIREIREWIESIEKRIERIERLLCHVLENEMKEKGVIK